MKNYYYNHNTHTCTYINSVTTQTSDTQYTAGYTGTSISALDILALQYGCYYIQWGDEKTWHDQK